MEIIDIMGFGTIGLGIIVIILQLREMKRKGMKINTTIWKDEPFCMTKSFGKKPLKEHEN